MKYVFSRSLLTMIAATAVLLTLQASVAAQPSESYPYRSARFTEFVNDSFRNGSGGDASDFYNWMDRSYRTFCTKNKCRPGFGLTDVLRVNKTEIEKISDPHARSDAEVAFAAWLHNLVKTTIPKFSLDRGFEFRNTVAFGERQCFLQSVLISGMLQAAGVRSGVEMVYKSISGEESNNGHAISLLRLSDGRDIIVDASEPQPFARQQGLFVKTVRYLYVKPQYQGPTAYIQAYKDASNGRVIKVSAVKTLGTDFLRSQFYYYRGERVPGGLLCAKKTDSGLRAARKYFEESVRTCPQNPLAVYMLGRVYLAQGERKKALHTLVRANKLYSSASWVPAGALEYLAIARHG